MLVAERDDLGHAVAVGVVHRPRRRGLHDQALLGLLVRGVGGVVVAVEQPRVGVERHVDHVDARVARIGERVDRRLQEEEARVLARANVHDGHVRRDPGDAEAVGRGGDGARHVGAVRAVVVVDRVDAARELARPVDFLAQLVERDVLDEVARQRGLSKFGAMSGWVPSTPVSMMPTLTRLSPGCLVRARSERTDLRPHSCESSGSSPAVAGGSSWPGAAEWPFSARRPCGRRSSPWASGRSR